MLTKRFILTILLFLFAGVASAQITVTAESIPGVGFTCLSHSTSSDVTVDNGSGGGDQTWTINNNQWPIVERQTRMVPAETPYASFFPNATLCTRYSIDVGDTAFSYNYYQLLSNARYEIGYVPTGYPPNVYDSPKLIIPLPLSYPHETWTSVARITNHGPVEDITLDSTIYSLDGWGTINTPLGSAQVLRVFCRGYFAFYTPPAQPEFLQLVGYLWLNEQGIEVVNVSAPIGTTSPNFTTGSVMITGLGDNPAEPARGPVARNFSVKQNYPNPFNPTTTVPIDLEKSSHVSMDIYDEAGRLVSHTEHDLTAGTHEVAVDGSAWASGSYFARVAAQDQSQTVKMLMVK